MATSMPMSLLRLCGLSLLFLLAPVGPVGAATVYLLNGEVVQGKVVDVTFEHVIVQINVGKKPGFTRIPLTEVMDIQADSGDSEFAKRIEDVLKQNRFEQVKDTEREKAKAQARAARGQGEDAAAGDVDAAGGDTGAGTTDPKKAGDAPKPGVQPDYIKISFTKVYDGFKMHGFKLNYPRNWGDPEQVGKDVRLFYDRQSEGGLWRFNVTAFERFDATFDDVKKESIAEFDALKEKYRKLAVTPFEIGGNKAHRTTGVFDHRGTSIRHEQVIVETRNGSVIMVQFFAPGAPEGVVPEFEAVIDSMNPNF